eukprot:GFYU01037880.1.p1 GENE.GFYU01037880.1~~GFYU01037880.1.p1  ORF type:complete len:496 (-),score=73.01 GFYU01037880.1:497-1930(-)
MYNLCWLCLCVCAVTAVATSESYVHTQTHADSSQVTSVLSSLGRVCPSTSGGHTKLGYPRLAEEYNEGNPKCIRHLAVVDPSRYNRSRGKRDLRWYARQGDRHRLDQIKCLNEHLAESQSIGEGDLGIVFAVEACDAVIKIDKYAQFDDTTHLVSNDVTDTVCLTDVASVVGEAASGISVPDTYIVDATITELTDRGFGSSVTREVLVKPYVRGTHSVMSRSTNDDGNRKLHDFLKAYYELFQRQFEMVASGIPPTHFSAAPSLPPTVEAVDEDCGGFFCGLFASKKPKKAPVEDGSAPSMFPIISDVKDMNIMYTRSDHKVVLIDVNCDYRRVDFAAPASRSQSLLADVQSDIRELSRKFKKPTTAAVPSRLVSTRSSDDTSGVPGRLKSNRPHGEAREIPDRLKSRRHDDDSRGVPDGSLPVLPVPDRLKSKVRSLTDLGIRPSTHTLSPRPPMESRGEEQDPSWLPGYIPGGPP